MAAFTASTETVPSARAAIDLTFIPASVALAGFVPCALSGTRMMLRRLAFGLVCGFDREQSGQLAVSPGPRAQSDRGHACQLEQPSRKRVHQLERTRDGSLWLEWMDVSKPRQPCQLLVEARIMLHRA